MNGFCAGSCVQRPFFLGFVERMVKAKEVDKCEIKWERCVKMRGERGKRTVRRVADRSFSCRLSGKLLQSAVVRTEKRTLASFSLARLQVRHWSSHILPCSSLSPCPYSHMAPELSTLGQQRKQRWKSKHSNPGKDEVVGRHVNHWINLWELL